MLLVAIHHWLLNLLIGHRVISGRLSMPIPVATTVTRSRHSYPGQEKYR